MSTLNRKKAKNLPCPTRTATEAPRGQTAVNYSNIENILETVIAPDDVSLVSDNTGTAMRFEKMLDGRNVAITITSTKKSTLTLKSAWIINQKSGGRTPSASADTLAGTSETNGRSSTLKQSTSPTPDVQAPSLTSETGRRIKTTSTSSISKNAENVNSELQKGKKFALPDTDSTEMLYRTSRGRSFRGVKLQTRRGGCSLCIMALMRMRRSMYSGVARMAILAAVSI